MADQQTPIIVVKKSSRAHGHHGGAWKVAYADFVTAMMAFFLVMWLVSQQQPVKEAVAGYFADPIAFEQGLHEPPSHDVPLTTPQVTEGAARDQADEETEDAGRVAETLRQVIDGVSGPDLGAQVEVTVVRDGVRVELVEGPRISFFSSGSASLVDKGRTFLEAIGTEIARTDYTVVIEGHTDSRPFPDDTYTNWELSVERANAARRVLEAAGLDPRRIRGVLGYADSHLRVPEDPDAPENRRVSIRIEWTADDTTPRPQPTSSGAF